MVLVLLTSLNCYMSTLRLVHYAILLTPAYWKSNNTNGRLMAFASSLALDPTFGIHSHKTLDTAQPFHLLKPNWKPSSSHSIFIPTNISTQFLLQSECVCVCVCVCCVVLCVELLVCVCACMRACVCACVRACVCDSDRDRDREFMINGLFRWKFEKPQYFYCPIMHCTRTLCCNWCQQNKVA